MAQRMGLAALATLALLLLAGLPWKAPLSNFEDVRLSRLKDAVLRGSRTCSEGLGVRGRRV